MRLALAIVVLAVMALTPLFGAETASEVIGLWRGGISAAQIGGELSVDGRKPNWQASIGSATRDPDRTTDVQLDRDKIKFDLVIGKFRGVVNGSRIVGHWIQPPNEINRHTGYATPVELNQVSNKVWRGAISSMPAQLTFWLSIQGTADGALTAVIRNPESNFFRRNNYLAELRGSTLSFSDPKKPDSGFEAQFDREKQLLSARLPNLDKPIQFERVKPEQAIGFYPRAPREQKYVYQRPKQESDGWRTASLADVGIDSKSIEGLIEKILAADPVNNSLSIHSLLIARHGKLALEEYFYGFKGEPHTMRSASKTFAPMLIGIARDKGAKIDINTQVLSQFPEYKEIANPDPRKSKITVRDLTTMTSGLACDDNDENSPGNEDVMQEQTTQTDWYKYTLDLPMARDPGGDQAVYCSAGINLLGGIVQHVTNTWLTEFFYENVAKPLQINTYHWNLMPNGDGYCGGGLYLRPRDQLKLGQLYLNDGAWNGRRVISHDWVQQSTSRQSTFGKTLDLDHDYGYGWHLYHFEVEDRTYRAYAAGGNGGQIVMVIPDLDLVVGFTGGAYGEFPKWYKWQTELVPQFIVPAAISTVKR